MKGVIAALAVAYLGRMVYNLDFGRELGTASDANCELLGGDVPGVEDLVPFRAGVSIGGSGNVLHCIEHSPETLDNGYMIAVDVRSGVPVLRKLEMELPKYINFHPHGIFYSKETERLYVVNHGGASNVGTRVELFSVHENGEGLPVLKWVMAIGGGHLFGNMVLNSVVEGAENEIYITQWQTFSVPEKGAKNPVTLLEKLGRGLDFLILLQAFRGYTGVHRCEFDVETKSTIACKPTNAWYFIHSNGLTINKERTTLFVNDPLGRQLTAYRRDPKSSELTYSHQLNLPWVIDNVHIDDTSGDLWMGSIPLVYHQLNETFDSYPGSFLVAHPQKPGSEAYSISEPIIHKGDKMSQIATCIKTSDPNSKKTWGLCGSPRTNGVLVCPLP